MIRRAMVGCETSGRTREALRARGIEAWSCDLLPSDDDSPYHFQGDIFHVMYVLRDWFDLLIVHPDCTFLTSSGLHWNLKRPERAVKTQEALQFVRDLMALPVKHFLLENPIGCIGTQIRPADFSMQPYEYGDDASKKTCFWVRNFPIIKPDPAKRFPGRWVMHKGKMVERWSNQTDSGQNKLAPSPTRWKERSATYPGIAAALADGAMTL